jgi:hypothetical protein
MHIIAAILLVAALTPQPHEPDEPDELNPDAVMIAKVIAVEAPYCSEAEQEAIAWVILNRVDTDGYGMGCSVEYVVTFPNQFAYYEDTEYSNELYDLALRVLEDWQAGAEGIGKQWLWFTGDGKRNTFRDAYEGGNTKTF